MRKAKKRFDPSYQFDIAVDNEKVRFLIGWPGYRTSGDKSGLDQIQTQAEWAHMQGLMFRWLITGKFKTRNLFYLFFITIHGLFYASPLLLLLAGQVGQSTLIRYGIIFIPYSFIGLLLLANVILSLIRCNPEESITGE